MKSNGYTFSLYNEDGKLQEDDQANILFRKTMINYIHGNIGTVDEQISSINDPIYPIELEITIIGIGGFIPGNVFHVDYIPENYKKYCVFQVISVDQTVNSGDWETTIKGQVRIAMNKFMADEIKLQEEKLTEANKATSKKVDEILSNQVLREEIVRRGNDFTLDPIIGTPVEKSNG